MTDLGTLLKQQMQNTLTTSLDSAVQAGDIQAARQAAKQIGDLAIATAPKPAVNTKPTTDDIKKAIMAKAPWFGVDPRKSAKAVELGKMMDPERFKTADEFADALLKAVEDDGKQTAATDTDDDNTNDDNTTGADDDNANEDDAAAQSRRTRRNGTAAPELNAGGRSNSNSSNLRRAFETGDIKLLPKDAADSINQSADKFARNGTKEQRATFIKNAVITQARRTLISTGKLDAQTGKFK